MKNYISIPKINICAVVFVVIFASTLFAQNERVCSVTGIMGTVKVLTSRDKSGADPSDARTWPDARLNMPLREKDMIAALGESEARLETADGSVIRLRENTVLELAALKEGGDAPNVRLNLVEGGLVTSVKKLASGKARFEFETPTTLAAIRGTNVEITSRKNYGTTVKTFDGSLEAGAKKSKARAPVGNYKMIEVGSPDRADNVRGIPSHYKQKSTKLLSEHEMSELTGFTRVILTYGELMEIKAQFDADGIVSGIGVGESDDEMTARNISADAARAEIAMSIDTRVQRLSESYAQNVGGEAKKIWEETVRQLTDVTVRGTTIHTTITQYSRTSGRYRIYSLMVMEPNRFKNMVSASSARHEEFELRVKKQEMMSDLDASIKALNTKYHDR